MFQVVLEDDYQLNHTSLRNGSSGFNSGCRRFCFPGKVPLGRAKEEPHGNWKLALRVQHCWQGVNHKALVWGKWGLKFKIDLCYFLSPPTSRRRICNTQLVRDARLADSNNVRSHLSHITLLRGGVLFSILILGMISMLYSAKWLAIVDISLLSSNSDGKL